MILHPTTLQGTVTVPASKSIAHRLLIAAALADAKTKVVCSTVSEDIWATVHCLTALGADITREGDAFLVRPLDREKAKGKVCTLPCGQSGTTLRLLLPVACALGAEATFTGSGRLPKRPVAPLCEVLTAHGVQLHRQGEDALPLTVSGQLQHGAFSVEANVSSQYFSGLLLALPLLSHSSILTAQTEIASRPYVDLTEAVLELFSVRIDADANKQSYRIPSNQTYRTPGEAVVEGDWSQGAFWMVGGAIASGGNVVLQGLSKDSRQGDKALVKILSQCYGDLVFADGAVQVEHKPTYGFCTDCTHIPDLVPILAVLAMAGEGNTLLFGISRLKSKESDRVQSVCELISALGGEYRLCDGDDSLMITGMGTLPGGKVKTYHDHRIAMAAAIASLYCQGEVEIDDPACVEKSYPDFWKEFARLTGN